MERKVILFITLLMISGITVSCKEPSVPPKAEQKSPADVNQEIRGHADEGNTMPPDD